MQSVPSYLRPTKAKALKESDERHEYQDVKQSAAVAARRALTASRAEAAAGARAVRALNAEAIRCVPCARGISMWAVEASSAPALFRLRPLISETGPALNSTVVSSLVLPVSKVACANI